MCYPRATAAFASELDTLLDALSHGARWVLLSPARAFHQHVTVSARPAGAGYVGPLGRVIRLAAGFKFSHCDGWRSANLLHLYAQYHVIMARAGPEELRDNLKRRVSPRSQFDRDCPTQGALASLTRTPSNSELAESPTALAPSPADPESARADEGYLCSNSQRWQAGSEFGSDRDRGALLWPRRGSRSDGPSPPAAALSGGSACHGQPEAGVSH